MFYTILGKAVWKTLKLALRNKYGRTYVPKRLIAAAVLVAALGTLLGLQRRESASS